MYKNYYISTQVSTLKYLDYFYLYNWYNDQGIKLENELCNIDFDKKRIVFYEYMNKDDINYLITNNFITTQLENNDIKLEKIGKIVNSIYKKSKIILMPAGYNCNFRCKYCYENKISSTLYTNKTLSILEKFINNLNIKPQLDYFGGEPLLNYQWIINFQKLIKNSITFSSITTNGYNLTYEVFDNLVNNKMYSFQITLDGHPSDHNYLRPLKDGSPTFTKILKNIKATKKLKKDFIINIRINFNDNTAINSKLDFLLNELEFCKGDFRYRLLFKPIDLYSDLNDTTTNEIKLSICKDQNLLQYVQNYAQEKGFLISDVSYLTRPTGLLCYAGMNNTYVIDHELNILKCTVAVDKLENKFGKILEDGSVSKNDNFLWNFDLKNIPLDCMNCFLLYQCIGNCCPAKFVIKNQKKCPSYKENENFYVNLIRKQKKLLKELINGN